MPTESQIRDRELRSRVRERIKNGRLPLILSRDILAGYGSGKNTCAACDQPITRDHIEYELKDAPIPVSLLFHFGCHAVWQIECAKRLTHLGDAEKQALCPRQSTARDQSEPSTGCSTGEKLAPVYPT